MKKVVSSLLAVLLMFGLAYTALANKGDDEIDVSRGGKQSSAETAAPTTEYYGASTPAEAEGLSGEADREGNNGDETKSSETVVYIRRIEVIGTYVQEMNNRVAASAGPSDARGFVSYSPEIKTENSYDADVEVPSSLVTDSVGFDVTDSATSTILTARYNLPLPVNRAAEIMIKDIYVVKKFKIFDDGYLSGVCTTTTECGSGWARQWQRYGYSNRIF